jgi:hypothetical protein
MKKILHDIMNTKSRNKCFMDEMNRGIGISVSWVQLTQEKEQVFSVSHDHNSRNKCFMGPMHIGISRSVSWVQ